MNLKQLIALPVLGMALGSSAYAGAIPAVNSINSWPTPQSYDFSFDNRNLTVSVANNVSGYTVTATGSGNFTFYGPSHGTAYNGTGAGYSLVANFDSSSNFVAAGSLLTINGTLPTVPGATGTPSGLLYSANLTDFGVNASQSAIAFTTQFNPSWSNQPLFTGGSTGEVVYLFDDLGLNTGHGRLSALISAVNANDLSLVDGKSYSSVRSVATVPVPLPALLFGTGLTAMLGIGRKRFAAAESV